MVSLFSPRHGQIMGVIGTVVDEELCYNNLDLLDINRDEFMNRDKFVAFMDYTSEDYFSNHISQTNGEFELLPLELLYLYFDFACGVSILTCNLPNNLRTYNRFIKIERSYNPSDTNNVDQSKQLYKCTVRVTRSSWRSRPTNLW